MSVRSRIVEAGKRLYNRGLIAGYEGNVSERDGDRVWITPSGVCKGFLTETDIIELTLDGQQTTGAGKPSSETKMHLKVYRSRPDIQAVVHAHPPIATGFACSGRGLDQSLTAETVLLMGTIPLVPYGTPSTDELAHNLDGHLHYNAMLLANHGALTLGTTLDDAYFFMEQVEHYARISLVANVLGSPNTLPCDEVDKLMALRKKFGIRTGEPAVCARDGRVEEYRFSRDELVNLITEILTELGG